jgi:hypothetical protein
MPAVKFFARLDLEEVSEDSEIPRFGMETKLRIDFAVEQCGTLETRSSMTSFLYNGQTKIHS